MVSGKAATAASHFSSMDRLSDAAGEVTGWAGTAGDVAGAPQALAAAVAAAGCADGEPAGRSLTGLLTGPLSPTADSWEAVL